MFTHLVAKRFVESQQDTVGVRALSVSKITNRLLLCTARLCPQLSSTVSVRTSTLFMRTN